MISNLRCIECGAYYHVNKTDYTCDRCRSPLEVNHPGMEWNVTAAPGIWKYKEMIHPTLPEEFIITLGEGGTYIHHSDRISQYVGIEGLYLKHEGRNPTGSFKDRGMTVAVSEAKRQGMRHAICASTGNTSSSAAAYATAGNIDMTVVVPSGKITSSKLAQAIAYGATIENIEGTFDDAMNVMRERLGKGFNPYPLNSINPWRLEGQKTIIYELIEELLRVDFIAVPAGNLGNISAFGKAIKEMRDLGVLYDIPRLIAVQAEGASPFHRFMENGEDELEPETNPQTIASAIRIGNPVNWKKARRSLAYTKGLTASVSDHEIMTAKRLIDASGIGCEPASAASLAGVLKLKDEGYIDHSDVVACILTGHMLKDTEVILQFMTDHMKQKSYEAGIAGEN